MDQMSKIIAELPNVLQYLVPGYICVLIFTAITSKKVENTVKFGISCVLSFCFITLINAAYHVFNWEITEIWVTVAISIALSVVIAILFAEIYTSRLFKKFIVKSFQRSPHDSIWRNVLDYEKGTNLKVYLKNKDYYIIGHFYTHEEKGNDSWFSLSAFIKTDIKTNKDIVNYQEHKDVYIVFNLKDVDTIEVF